MSGGYTLVLERAGEGALKVYDLFSDHTAPNLESDFSLPGGYPRDLALIPDYSFKLTPDSPLRRATLLAVVGSTMVNVFGSGPSALDTLFDLFIGGQPLRIIDISDPSNPVTLATRVLTASSAVVNKVLWRPPYLVYLETGSDLQQIGVVDLQTLLLGFHQNAASIEAACAAEPNPAECVRSGVDGIDANQDGDYVDPRDTLPIPPANPIFFAGKVDACLPDPAAPEQRILDFDYQAGYCAATLQERVTEPIAQPSYVTLKDQAIDVAARGGTLRFGPGARPARVKILTQVPLEFEDPVGVQRKDIALVSLSPAAPSGAAPTGNADPPTKLAVIDLETSPPSLLNTIPLPAGGGLANSVELRDDGLLALALGADLLLLDPTRLALPIAPGRDLHPAILGRISSAGSGSRTGASNVAGLNATRNVIAQSAPRLRFVSFPTDAEDGSPRTELVRPEDLLTDPDVARATLDEMLVASKTSPISPARFRAAAGAVNTLGGAGAGTADPRFHYHVLVDAPGGAGKTIPIALESLNHANYPLANRGEGFPPVRAMAGETLEALGQQPRMACDAVVPSFEARRLSDDRGDPLYNQYLSPPFALLLEGISTEELADLEMTVPNRPVLWSGDYLRASLDGSVSQSPVLAPFTSKIEGSGCSSLRRVGASLTLATVPGPYLMGPNPPPATGDVKLAYSYGSVSARSGEVRHETVDMALPGRRMPLVFARHYANQDRYVGPFGNGWDFNYGQRLIPLDPAVFPPGMKLPIVIREAVPGVPGAPAASDAAKDEVGESGDVLLQNGAGRVIVFKFQGETAPPEIAMDPLVKELEWDTKGNAFYTADAAGVFDILVGFPGGEFVRLTPDGMRYWYSKRGILKRVQDRYPENEPVLAELLAKRFEQVHC